MIENGTLMIETDTNAAGTEYTDFPTSIAINDGAPHVVVVKRASGLLTVTIDGAIAGSATSTSSLDTLPTLEVGTDPCVGVPGTGLYNLVGTVSSICVASR